MLPESNDQRILCLRAGYSNKTCSASLFKVGTHVIEPTEVALYLSRRRIIQAEIDSYAIDAEGPAALNDQSKSPIAR